MRVASAMWPRVRPSTRPHFMRRAMPLTAGISNVRLRDDWTEKAGGRILGYSRGVSTGPMLPLVLSPTTLGEEMNLGISYRATGVHAGEDRPVGRIAAGADRGRRADRVLPLPDAGGCVTWEPARDRSGQDRRQEVDCGYCPPHQLGLFMARVFQHTAQNSSPKRKRG
jgi:hypothetical protein